jgi:thiamine kinase-like enzyme
MIKRSLAIPDRPEMVTAVWLTKALRASKIIKNAAVKSYKMDRVGAEEGFSGQIARFHLSYDTIEKRAPASLICKLSSDKPAIRADFKKDYACEVQFYAEIAPQADLPVPTCYYQAIDTTSGASVLLLEDLSHFHAANLIGGCTASEVDVVVTELAKIHGHWWNHPELIGDTWLSTPRSFAKRPFPQWWSNYPKIIANLLPDYPLPLSVFKVGQQFSRNMEHILNQLSVPPLTFIHRDVHADNLLFGIRPTHPPLMLFDWAYAGRGRGIGDITYFMVSSVSPKLRQKFEESWMNRYYAQLIQSGVQNYSLTQCWHDYKIAVVNKLFISVMATVLFDNNTPQRRAWRLADLRRITAFLEDHAVTSFL